MGPEDLLERLIAFGASVGKLADALPETRMGRHVAGQIIRSGTSPAPNYAEGCAAESRDDFIHKLSICLKELRETRTWLRLILKSELLPPANVAPVLDEAVQLGNIIGQSIVTAKNNAARRR
jgi:four helix bundle protein